MLLTAVFFGALAGLWMSLGGHATSPMRSLLARVEQLTELAGFGLEQVAITGHRFTSDSDIFDAIDLRHARTMLSFDSRAAQARIERLPWIEHASIERIVPGRLEVQVTERAPFAVWKLGDRYFLVDKTGRTLSAVPANAMPNLPRIAGAGAANEAAALFALLATHPELRREVDQVERVGERRWTLMLTDGRTIQLPEDAGADALQLAWRLGHGMAQWDEIDLRVRDRIVVRTRPSAPAPRAKMAAGGI